MGPGVELEEKSGVATSAAKDLPDGWFVARDGKTRGPVAEETLRDLAALGELRPTDHLWRKGLEGWMTASSLPGLFAADPEATPHRGTAVAEEEEPEPEAEPRPAAPCLAPAPVAQAPAASAPAPLSPRDVPADPAPQRTPAPAAAPRRAAPPSTSGVRPASGPPPVPAARVPRQPPRPRVAPPAMPVAPGASPEHEKDVRNAVGAAIASGVITLIFTLVAMAGASFAGITGWNLLDVALIFGLAYGVSRRSRACATILFGYFIISKLMMMVEHPTVAGLPLALIIGYYYAKGMMATYAIHGKPARS
jgi:serine/threonine-protein kinase